MAPKDINLSNRAAQIRAARALIGWKQSDLASASGLSEMSVKNLERGVTDPRSSTLDAVERAFNLAGVRLLTASDGGYGAQLV